MIAIYARQSLDKKDSISIETQIELCKKEIGDEPYKEYVDRGYSGLPSNVTRRLLISSFIPRKVNASERAFNGAHL